MDCIKCDGSGWLAEGRQVSEDRFDGCTCDNCGGDGEQPRRPAGKRFTGKPTFDTLNPTVYRAVSLGFLRRTASRYPNSLARQQYREHVSALIGPHKMAVLP